MEVSVIIVNYKTSALVADCLKSVINLTKGVEYEVIIVDNNSEPNFRQSIIEKVPEASSDNFIYLNLPENIGFGRANNEGIKIAKGRNIFFLNPDTILLNNAIKILSDFLDSHPQAGACGGNLYNETGQPVVSYKRFFPGLFWEIDDLFNSLPQKLVYGKNRIHNYSSGILSVAYITGADLMVKKEVAEKTGGFSNEFFLYFEETDLCRRIYKAGWKIFNVPEARIMHLESKSMGTDEKWESEFKTQWLEKSRKIYYKRNSSSLEIQLYNLIYDLFLTSRKVLINNPRKKEYYKIRKKYFKAHN